MNRKERITAILMGKSVDRPPVCFYKLNGIDENPNNCMPEFESRSDQDVMGIHQSRNLYILFAFLIVLILPTQAQAYIGPGAGFAVAGSFFVIFTAIISAIITVFTWPIRYIIRAIRGRRAFARSRVKKVVILGLDGMDYAMTKKFLSEGKLPNLAKLQDCGCFKPLATTIPSMSPVAWSSFQTGVNPGKHNIFDFLTHNRQTYLPKLSSVDIKPCRRMLKIGKYQFPLGKAEIRLLRKSIPFWQILGKHGIFSSIIRVPITFPPEKFYGVQLSGMCVPDLRGTQGMFSFYTTKTGNDGEHTGGDYFRVVKVNNTIEAELVGPDNPLTKAKNVLKCPFVITLTDSFTADIAVNGASCKLKINEYSDWIKVTFKAAPGIKVRGICKFLLISTMPEFQLYVSPINIDPERPAMPIGHPAIYPVYLSKRQGPFATLGLAEDSWALNEKFLSDDGFLQQCIQFDEEREKMFFDSLDKVKHGLCVCVFDGTDRVQHAFWRQLDETHPAHQGQFQRPQNNAIEEIYQRADRLVGRTLGKCNRRDTMVMIISDHGFNVFRYGVDLNSWLEEKGYLKLNNDGRNKKNLTGIDFSRTQAFAIGLSGIFLNLKGREARGIVDPGAEAASLRDEIAAQLTDLADPIRKQPAIKQVYNALKIFSGPYKNNAPDLLVGYQIGYRASWETAIGQVTDKIFHENTKAWSGDHCIDPSLVPGILFCNRRIETEMPALMDIGPTVLDMFGVEIPSHMDGKALVVADTEATGKRKN